jgi:SEC-C motif-containing protein
MSARLESTARCPCLSGNPYGECCEPLHRGERVAPTAEQLMRSRYSAFAVGDAEYLLASWHPRTRPGTIELDRDQRWIRLDIDRTVRGGPFDTVGDVSFVAHYRQDGQRHELRETSRFERIDGRWYYLAAAQVDEN